MAQTERPNPTGEQEHGSDGWTAAGESFGARLALIRHRMGWNIKEAAVNCAIPPQTWRFWELIGGQPRNLMEVCERISRITRCDSEWLAHGFENGDTEAVAS